MIQITLTFTSLAAALNALRQIPENTLQGALTDITPAPAEPEAQPTPKPVARARKAAPAPEAAPAPTTVEPAAPQAPVDAPTPVNEPAVQYSQLSAAVMRLAGRNRDAALAIASGLGVKNFRDLEPARYSEALGLVEEKLAELETVQ